jgi:two-component system sporulation sensor kinase A
MTELFANLLDNAYQSFSNKKGTIKIAIDYKSKKGKCYLHFEDNGVGINNKDIPKIFDPFFTTRHKGTGLGLTGCNQLVHLHGGFISVKSQEKKGTTISVILPIKAVR